MPNLGNRIPDNPNGILCSASEQKGAKSNPNGILCSAKLPIAGIRQLKRNTMFCERAEKCKTATRMAYYILRNWRLQGSGNSHGILYSAKLLIAGIPGTFFQNIASFTVYTVSGAASGAVSAMLFSAALAAAIFS